MPRPRLAGSGCPGSGLAVRPPFGPALVLPCPSCGVLVDVADGALGEHAKPGGRTGHLAAFVVSSWPRRTREDSCSVRPGR